MYSYSGFGAADEQIDLEIFPVKPFHFVFYDAVLKKYLLCRRADVLRRQMIEKDHIRRTRLNVRGNEIIRPRSITDSAGKLR